MPKEAFVIFPLFAIAVIIAAKMWPFVLVAFFIMPPA